MSNSTPVAAATASEVREHFRSNATALAALSEPAQRTVAEGARGRLHPEAVAAFNKGRSKAARYVEGNEVVVPVTYRKVTSSGSRKAVVNLTPEAVRLLAGVTGKRGPLPKDALDLAGLAYAESVNG